MTPPASTEPQAFCCATCDNEGDRCPIQKYIKHTKIPPSIPLMAAGILISGNCKIPFSCHSRARGPMAQQAPTNRLAIPCPKCGKWIFRANVDEGYTLFCSDDECGWKQKIVVQQEPAVTADNIIEITKAQLDDDIIREAIHLSIHQRENFSQAEPGAALIAQEREKWERESPIYPCPVVRCTSKYRLGGSDSDDQFVCGECGDTPLDNVKICPAIAAQARERVLEIFDTEIDNINLNIHSLRLNKKRIGYMKAIQESLRKIKSLRSEVRK